jgi:hypothetical protein
MRFVRPERPNPKVWTLPCHRLIGVIPGKMMRRLRVPLLNDFWLIHFSYKNFRFIRLFGVDY